MQYLQAVQFRLYFFFLYFYYKQRDISIFDLYDKFENSILKKYKKTTKWKKFCDAHKILQQEEKKDETTKEREISLRQDDILTKFTINGDFNLEEILIEKKKCLFELDIESCSFYKFPLNFCYFNNLHILKMKFLAIDSLPDSFENLINLTELTIKLCCFKEFPNCLFKLVKLQNLTFNAFENTLVLLKDDLNKCFDENWKIFQKFGLNKQKFMSIVKNHQEENFIKKELFEFIPCLSEISFQLASMMNISKNLTFLELSYQNFAIIDDTIAILYNLRVLLLKSNENLQEITPKICRLPLISLKIENCPLLKTPPMEIVKNGMEEIMNYMKRLLESSVECKRTKLMVVGLGGAGKTSLINRFLKIDEKNDKPKITDGILIKNWSINSIEYSIWDFAGQTVYYNTHQFFISNRAVYLLLWNVRLGYQHAGLDFWLNSIKCHAPKAPVFVIGSHIDEVQHIL